MTAPVSRSNIYAWVLSVVESGGGGGGEGPPGPPGPPGSPGSGGSGSAGALVVTAYPFVYNTSGILSGAELYTPTIGDIIYDILVDIDTAWDGLTPQFDLGTFAIGANGLFKAATATPIPLWTASASLSSEAGLRVATGCYSWAAALQAAATVTDTTVLAPLITVTAADPIYAVVAQDGTKNTATAATLTATNAPSSGLSVSGSNNQFNWLGTSPTAGGGGLSPETFTVANGSYGTLGLCVAAMAAAKGSSGEAFDTICSVVDNGSGKIKLTMLDSGAAANGNQIQAATSDDISTALGFTAPSIFNGGAGGDPGSTHGSATLYILSATPTT